MQTVSAFAPDSPFALIVACTRQWHSKHVFVYLYLCIYFYVFVFMYLYYVALGSPHALIVACTRRWYSEHLCNLGHCAVTLVWMSPFTGSAGMHAKYEEQDVQNGRWLMISNCYVAHMIFFFLCVKLSVKIVLGDIAREKAAVEKELSKGVRSSFSSSSSSSLSLGHGRPLAGMA